MPAYMYDASGKRKAQYRNVSYDKKKKYGKRAVTLKGSKRKIAKTTREDGEARMKMGAAS